MISILITSYKEPLTIGKAIESFLAQKIREKHEIIICAPDKETIQVAKKYAKINKNIKIIKDSGRGKPTALNEAFKKIKGDIIILSDGDVYIGKNAVREILKAFKNKEVGAVSGRPISTNSKDTMFGFWAYLLTEGIHEERKKAMKKNENIVCSGYLYAIRNLNLTIPENILADDAYISFAIIERGYKSIYGENAKVYVKYPDNLKDWIKQKKRTASRVYQLSKYFKVKKVKNFVSEFLIGIKTIFLIKNMKQLFWFFLLIIMRFYIWFRIFFDFRLWKREFRKSWQRVESTK